MIVELSGTPSSGKDSIIAESATLNINNFKIITNDKSPFNYTNSTFELRILWSILDTLSQVENFRQLSPDSNLTIVERGIFDRIAWARLLGYVNSSFRDIGNYVDEWLKSHIFLQQTEAIFLLLTSYEKILERKAKYRTRDLRPFWVVNPDIIRILNEIYEELYSQLGNRYRIILIDDLYTDVSLQQKVEIFDSELDNLIAS